MYKFRCMYMDAEERKAELMEKNKMSDGMMFKLDDDPRIIGSEKKDKEKKAPKTEKGEKKPKEKKEKREGEPKKPPSAYFLFCADKRKENKDKKLSAKELGEMYTNLAAEEKDRYKKIYDESLKKYEEDMALFKKNHPEEEKEKEDKKKAKPSKCDQKKSNKKACNCGKCDECKAKNKANDDEDDDE